MPTLTDILNSGDKGLRGNIAASLIQDIFISKSDKHQSDWLDDFLKSALRSIEQWSVDYTVNSNNSELRNEKLGDNSYLFKGGVAANNYQYGNPFPAKKGDIVKISLADELTGWQLDKDSIIIKVVIGGNDGTTQEVILSNKENEKVITIKENANHHITIYNDNNQLVNYSILLTLM